MFFKGTGKALLSLITRHPDEKSDSVQVAMEALHRASILGEPIRIHQRLTRYCNSYLVNFNLFIKIRTLEPILGFETVFCVRIHGAPSTREHRAFQIRKRYVLGTRRRG